MILSFVTYALGTTFSITFALIKKKNCTQMINEKRTTWLSNDQFLFSYNDTITCIINQTCKNLVS